MAHVCPDLPFVPGAGRRAEHELLDALRRGLDDTWFVFPRMSYVDPRRAAEGEADVLVVHRTRGMLAIECKGAGVRRTEGRWQRMLEDGRTEPLDESPFAQAQRTSREVVRLLEERARPLFAGLSRLPLVHGHAVAFPRAASLDGASLDGPRELLLLAEDLRDAGAWVERALAFWARSAPRIEPFDEASFRRFRRQVLYPSVKIVPSLASTLHAERQVFARLSDEQTAAVDAFADNPRISVLGPAGTGKTLVALELARRAASEGRRVLFTCFTKALAQRLKHEVRALEAPLDARIDVAHFHSLCWRAAEAIGRPLRVPDVESTEVRARYWSEEAPLALADAIATGAVGPWDAILVDEAQDFEGLWWMVLEEALAKASSPRFAIFHDPAQLLYGREAALPEAPSFRLTRNLRNTRALAETARLLHPGAAPPSPFVPEGEPPTVLHARNGTRALAALEDLVERLVSREGVPPEAIVILTPHSRPRSSLAGVTSVAGIPLEEHRQPSAKGALAHTTIGAFKGLEADLVVLLDADPDDPRCTRAARYVAATRARHRLFVIGDPAWTR